MKTMTITFAHGAQHGHPVDIQDGQIVTCNIPAGCALMAGPAVTSLAPVASPFVASGSSVVRLDCVTYTGPVTATLSIE